MKSICSSVSHVISLGTSKTGLIGTKILMLSLMLIARLAALESQYFDLLQLMANPQTYCIYIGQMVSSPMEPTMHMLVLMVQSALLLG